MTLRRWAVPVFVVVTVALIVVPLALAQNPTGTLIGKVLDVQGGELPGVMVTAISPNLQGDRSTLTGVNGDYKLPFLPAGSYTVQYERVGLATAVRDVRISAAQTQISDIRMQELALVEESIDVAAARETISETTTAATTYSHDEVEKLTVGRDPVSVSLLTPGVTVAEGGKISIAGAMSFENLWLVNGAVVQNVGGQPLPLYIEDAIQETTTLVSGISAEYGRFTGGVVNALTRSGGNQFSGSLRVSFTSDAWQAKTPLSGDRVGQIDPTFEATLGGFFWKDHLWFFAAGRDLDRSETSQTYLTNKTFPTGWEQQRLEGKLTISFSPNHNLIASYLQIDELITNDQFGLNIDSNGLTDSEQPQNTIAINYTGILTPAVFLEAQYSERNLTIKSGGADSRTLTEGTLMRWTGTDYRYYTPTFCGVCSDLEGNNRNILVKASYFLTTERAGTHDIVVGYDSFEDITFGINHQTGSDFTVWSSDAIVQSASEIYPQFLGSSTWIGWWAVFNPELARPTSFKTNSFYVNDNWQLNEKLVFNIGLRYDGNNGKNSSGARVVDDAKLSPRLGVTWDVKGDGDVNINLSYGTYVAAIQGTGNIAGSTSIAGAIGLLGSFYFGPLVNTDPQCLAAGTCTSTRDALEVLFDWYLANGGTTDVNGDFSSIPGLFVVDVPGETSVIPDTMRSPSADEIAVGVIKRLGTKGSFRVDLVHRVWDDFYSNRTTPDFQKVSTRAGPVDLEWVGNFGNDVLEREYWGLHTQGRYRITDRLTVAGVYTLSRLEGNNEGETLVNGAFAHDVHSYPEYQEKRWALSTGNLASDRRHKLRAWVTYDAVDSPRHSLSVTWMEGFWSGTPFGSHGSVDTRPFVSNPGYASPPVAVTYWYEPRDAYRTSNVHSSDLALNYAFRWELWNTPMEVFLQPEITNLFNEDEVAFVNLDIVDAMTGGNCGSGPCQTFNPFTEDPVEGVHWRKGNSFGEPVSESDYVNPRTFRFSVGFRFK